MVQNLRATAHLSRQLGRWGARAWALGVRGRAGGRCRRAGAQRQAELAAGWARRGRARTGAGRADGCAGLGRRGARQALARGARRRGAVGARAGMARARGWAHGARGARPAWAWPWRWRVADWASWASFGALCTWLSSGSVFGPGSTRYFPESPNEHCSL